MKFGNSNHQNVKMPDWIWSSGPDLAPLSRNRVNPNKVDVWNPCQVWQVVAATTTLKKSYKLLLFDQTVSQIRAYNK